MYPSHLLVLPPHTQQQEDADGYYVEVGTKTSVEVTATAYDERPGQESGDVGCGADGCLPDLAHDGIGEDDVESRWSCSKEIVPGGGQCEITFAFGTPQDIMDVEVAFWKGDERSRTLKVFYDVQWSGSVWVVSSVRTVRVSTLQPVRLVNRMKKNRGWLIGLN